MQEYYGKIYEIINKVNGRIYVGQTTKSLKERLRKHKNSAFFKSRPNKSELQKDIIYYGIDNFSISEICKCIDNIHMDIIETYYIKRYKKIYGKKCYNSRLGINLSEEAKNKISNANKGNIAWNKGKKCPQFAGKNNGMYGKRGLQKTTNKIKMIDKNIEKIFNGSGEAVDYLKSIGFDKASNTSIIATCKEKRKSAYGYKWEYANDLYKNI